MLKKSTLLSVSVFFLLFIGLNTPSYACHGGGPPHPPDCGKGKGGGKTHNPTVTTEVQWGGEGAFGNITEDIPRPCVAALLEQNGDYGSYTCSVGPPSVTYTLGTGDPTPRTRVRDLCSVFDGGRTLTPDRRYGHGWNDNCDEDDTCTIQIDTWFSGQEAIDATGGAADLIKFRAFAQATEAFEEANPFVLQLILQVDEIIISFSATGSNRNIATCHYRPDLLNLTEGDVIFQINPIPIP